MMHQDHSAERRQVYLSRCINMLHIMHADLQQEASAMHRAQVLRVSETHHLTILHDADARADALALEHVVRRQHDGVALSGRDLAQQSPHQSTRHRIQTCAGLVQVDGGRAAQQSNGQRDLTTIASREMLDEFVLIFADIQRSHVRLANSLCGNHHDVICKIVNYMRMTYPIVTPEQCL